MRNAKTSRRDATFIFAITVEDSIHFYTPFVRSRVSDMCAPAVQLRAGGGGGGGVAELH